MLAKLDNREKVVTIGSSFIDLLLSRDSVGPSSWKF